MLQPKRTKFRKFHKGRAAGILQNTPSGSALSFGKYGLKTLIAGRLSARVIEAARRTMTRKMRRSGQLWIRVFPDIAVSTKPAEVRMGKGKGNPEYWMCRVQAGQILFEIDGISIELAKQAAALASHKIPFPTLFVVRI
jgi:large subunit ribosomal protein L16